MNSLVFILMGDLFAQNLLLFGPDLKTGCGNLYLAGIGLPSSPIWPLFPSREGFFFMM